MGYNYVFQWAIVLPLELVVAGLTVNYWGADVNVAVWITVFLIAIIIINIFGVLGYAEEEFWVALLKLGTVVVFMIMALIFVCGGGPEIGDYSEYWGARTWYNPGAFADGFHGVCAVFVTAAFAFSGTELVGLAAAESETPQKSLPSAVKQVFWRITLYVSIERSYRHFFVTNALQVLYPWSLLCRPSCTVRQSQASGFRVTHRCLCFAVRHCHGQGWRSWIRRLHQCHYSPGCSVHWPFRCLWWIENSDCSCGAKIRAHNLWLH